MTSQRRLTAVTTSRKPPTDRSGYSPKSVKYCTGGKRTSRADYHKQRQRRVYQQLVRGMHEEPCIFFTLTSGQDRLLLLRPVAWHRLSAHLYRQWPEFQACSVYEYAKRRGVHLHVVVKGTPGITEAWLQHVVCLIGNGTQVGGWREVYDVEGLAAYLTKDLGDAAQVKGWPKRFRPATFTRKWCPRWRSQKEWTERRRAS
jgi:hypothetical protein